MILSKALVRAPGKTIQESEEAVRKHVPLLLPRYCDNPKILGENFISKHVQPSIKKFIKANVVDAFSASLVLS